LKFCIITHTKHHQSKTGLSAYGPYVREMNLWANHVDSMDIVAPETEKPTAIFQEYNHSNVTINPVASFSLTSLSEMLRTLFKLPKILYVIYSAMRRADHIHLRCPGNMGLLGCIVQIFFPSKLKTAKYAGNWDPKSNQPTSYRLQKWILSNTSLTKNCKVLVYGEWPNQTNNIIPFFTATYSEADKQPTQKRDYTGKVQCLFVGSLTTGKQPLEAIKLVKEASAKGHKITLDIYGDGEQRNVLEDYIQQNSLEQVVRLHGNQASDVIQEAYRKAHFLILPSKSEGWPKVVAEAMFWACIPVTTKVSCVPWMLDYGNRGFLIDEAFSFHEILQQETRLEVMSSAALQWSRQYTLDKFESDIKGLL